ncbi:hypothetical protein CIB84_007257 [Bambusicola thoracicus]|uniref:Cadherin domain-containing protein n=1 Tax=Bambusicola thoracicus TaxID=9083 RepID=A0A2P4SY05_BAMTH|nr:hypothetical protein CIB84_007257 [Bambusicola thoracicus]
MRFLNLGPFRDTTTVHISVEDVDEPPVFEPSFYFVEVPEDVEIGATIQIISAKDPDVTNNSIRQPLTAPHLLLLCSRIVQLIQTVSAIDRDDPQEGQHFYYSLAPEAANNPNFTLRDNQGNQSRHGQLATLISNVRVGLESL